MSALFLYVGHYRYCQYVHISNNCRFIIAIIIFINIINFIIVIIVIIAIMIIMIMIMVSNLSQPCLCEPQVSSSAEDDLCQDGGTRKPDLVTVVMMVMAVVMRVVMMMMMVVMRIITIKLGIGNKLKTPGVLQTFLFLSLQSGLAGHGP